MARRHKNGKFGTPRSDTSTHLRYVLVLKIFLIFNFTDLIPFVIFNFTDLIIFDFNFSIFEFVGMCLRRAWVELQNQGAKRKAPTRVRNRSTYHPLVCKKRKQQQQQEGWQKK